MYKIAIIDDDAERKAIYEDLLKDQFSIVSYISTPLEMYNAPDLEVHAYLMDLFYEGGQYDGITWDSIIENINKVKHVPIILISSKWAEFSKPETISKFCKFNNIVDCWGWDVMGNKVEAIPYQMDRRISEFYKYTNKVISDNEKVTILHLSDLQFGDASTDAASYLSQFDIPRTLNDLGKKPDIIVISGDIATYGQKTEYDAAYKWLNEFTTQLWGNNSLWNQRIIIVPGNHDIDENMSIPNVYEWDYKSNDFCTTHAIKKRESIISSYQGASFLNYRYFMQKVTGDYKYLSEDNELFFVNEHFLKWGIRFYEINTVNDISPLDRRKISISTNNIETLKKNTLNMSDTNIFNIIVSHFGPEIINTESNSNEWRKMRSFFESAKINMLLDGHVHKCSIKQLNEIGAGSFFSEFITVSTAGTVSLSATARPDDEPRGFNVIELERENGVVTKVKGTTYNFTGPSIVPGREYTAPCIKYNRP